MGNNSGKQLRTPKGSSQGTEYDWALDYISEFIKSPLWHHQVLSFVDENCLVFDKEEESRHCHHDIWKQFNSMVEDLLAKYVNALGLTLPQVMTALSGGGKTVVVDSIMKYTDCCNDFLEFKKMMYSRNVELEREALAIIYNRPSAEQGMENMTEENLIELAIKRSLEQKREDEEFSKAIEASKFDNQVEGSPKAVCPPNDDINNGVQETVEGEGEEEGRSPTVSIHSDKRDSPPAASPPAASEEMQPQVKVPPPPQEDPPVYQPEVQVSEPETSIEVPGIADIAPTKTTEKASNKSVKLSSGLPSLGSKLPPLKADIGMMKLPTLTAEDIRRIEQKQSKMKARVQTKKDSISGSPSPGLRTWANQTPMDLEKRKQFLLKQKKLLLKNKQLDRAKELRNYDTTKLISAVEKTAGSAHFKSTPGEQSEEERKRMKIRKDLAERFKNDFRI